MSAFENQFLKHAIQLAQESVRSGGFPAGAIVTMNDEIVGKGISNGRNIQDPTGHAEIAAIRETCKNMGTTDLKGAVMYSSLEPCLMCFAASHWASMERIVFACARNSVSVKYFEGSHDLQSISAVTNRHIELLHHQFLEEQALQVIKEWERSLY